MKKKRVAAVRPQRGFTFSARASSYILPTVIIVALLAGIVAVSIMSDLAISPITLSLTIDPAFIGIGAAVGLVLGLIVLGAHKSRAATSQKKHRKTRMNVQKETAPIICESHAHAGKSLGRGRLYFTGNTIEFYSNKFEKKPHKNIYIKFEDIRSISCKGSNKLYISSKNVTYKFKLPRGSAKYWAAELIHY